MPAQSLDLREPSYGGHRIAASFVLAGWATQHPIRNWFRRA